MTEVEVQRSLKFSEEQKDGYPKSAKPFERFIDDPRNKDLVEARLTIFVDMLRKMNRVYAPLDTEYFQFIHVVDLIMGSKFTTHSNVFMQ